MKNYAYLICVDELQNNNKFYEIKQNDDNSIDVTYGRVGVTSRNHHYNPTEKNFYVLRDDKVRNGYEDVTALHSVRTSKEKSYEELQYEPIQDEEIKELIENLIKSSRDFMKQNYTVSLQEITEKMIAEADNDIDELSEMANRNCSVWQFNDKLRELYADIPRKMENVGKYMAKTEADYERIIDKEREMLDNVRGQMLPSVENNISETTKKGTVLDAYGLTVHEATYKQEDEITAHLGKDYGYNNVGGRTPNVERRFVKAYCVENERTRREYEEFKQEHNLSAKDCRLFYHGSKVENWFSIMKQGMSLNPDAKVTGKMFGAGLYFASEARKALNYMDVSGSVWNDGKRESGYTAVYAVALGKCYKPCGALGSQFTAKDLKDGCLSVYADKNRTGLRNDEYIVYDQRQCTIKYLLEMTKYDVRELEFSFDRKDLRDKMTESIRELTKIPNGLRAELIFETLPDNALSLIEDRIITPFEADRVFIDYDVKRDKISFTVVDYNGNSKEVNTDFTKDDIKFLTREFKKAFADREGNWKEIVVQSHNYRTGEKVIDKDADSGNEVKPKKNNQIEKE